MRVPVGALYGAQTQRAVENFPISGQRFGRRFIQALGLIKKSAAETNAELGNLEVLLAFSSEQAAGQFVHDSSDLFEEDEEVDGLVVDGSAMLEQIPQGFGILLDTETDDEGAHADLTKLGGDGAWIPMARAVGTRVVRLAAEAGLVTVGDDHQDEAPTRQALVAAGWILC